MRVIELRQRDGSLYIEVEIYGTVYVIPFTDWLKLLADTAEAATLYLAAQIAKEKGSGDATHQTLC